jgi:hypothetical protein
MKLHKDKLETYMSDCDVVWQHLYDIKQNGKKDVRVNTKSLQITAEQMAMNWTSVTYPKVT